MYSRLNYLRFFLALTVLAYHANFFSVPLGGTLAVWCFFVISGYLVTEILYGRYLNRPREFLLNRFLRIYPIYWVSAAIGVALYFLLPESPGNSHLRLILPQGYQQWLLNMTLFGSTVEAQQVWIVSPAWSLAIEMKWYLILFVGSFFPTRFLICFFIVVLTIPVYLHFVAHEKVLLSGSGYCFAIGALAYHLKCAIPQWLQWIALALLPVLLFVSPRYFGLSAFGPPSILLWLHYMAVPLLLFLSMPWLSRKSNASVFSQLAGEISYPLFLTHAFMIYILVEYFDMRFNNWSFVAVVSLFTLLLSFAMVILVDRPISKVRTSIRMGRADGALKCDQIVSCSTNSTV